MMCVRILLVGLVTAASVAAADDPPPFGTVVQQWELGLSGSYAGAGMTWRRDSERFYLADQGYAGPTGMWSCDPRDPVGTLRRENWVFPNMGSGTADIPWSLAWDNDSGCYWISNIVDGNIYGGCYYTRIRKTAVGDTWRWFSENPGDTWLVGTGSGGGGGNMYWMAGSEKWFGRGYFICVPVAPTGPYSHMWKFDPYTKTSVGRCTNDTGPSRVVTLVPWDSNYIITTGWNANRFFKRDSTGLILDSAAATVYGPAGLALWIPRSIAPDDTVFMYCICSDPNNTLLKISVGMLWNQLPSINPSDLRPVAILAPSGTVDSGTTVTPRLVVQNTSVPADGVNAHFVISTDGVPVYTDSITGMWLDPWATETLSFTEWIPQGRDTMGVIAWTCWSGDSFPEDDTIRNRFLVRVKDIAVTEITAPVPDTVLDSGVVFAPQCRVWNYGNVAVRFDVRFRIGSWQATRNVSIIPGGSKLITAPTPYTAMPGIWACRASAVVTGDLHPEDNIKADTFTVRGTITKDVDARAVLAPVGVVDTGQTITPKARFGNNGADDASFSTFFSILDSDGAQVYAESSQVMLAAGDSTDIEYPPVKLAVMGSYAAACSVAMDGDQNSTNDCKLDTFEVGATGVAEAPKAPLSYGLSPIANPCRGQATICFNSPFPTPYSLSLYDATGRLVHSSFGLRTSPFRLDLRSMPVGVYVLRLNAGTFACSKKIILQH
jgi:hypothetical protein